MGIINTTINITPEWVSAISSIVIAFSTFFMAIAAVLFGKRQLDEMRKEKERHKIAEISRKIIGPFISQLEDEIRLLKEKCYDWDHRIKNMRNIKEFVTLKEEEEVLYGDFCKRNTEIPKEVETHDKEIRKLRKKLTELDELIYTPEFISKCKKLVEEFNEKAKENKKIHYGDYCPGYFVSYVIDDLKQLPHTNVYHLFWTKMGEKLLEIREEPEVRSQIREICEISQRIIDLSSKLKNKLEGLRDSYSAEYYLTVEEISEKSLM
ncbi:MAG: hypothetical protein QMC77_02810 [Methanocellales archaeon]|nr:hypothetical protein [Methanocellales archaeon]